MSAGRRRDTVPPAVYQAAAALVHDDRASALHGLRDQLRIMARAAGADPDWTTLTLAGPVTLASAQPRALFEWTASVNVPGAVAWTDLPDPDVDVLLPNAVDDTMPLGGGKHDLRLAASRNGPASVPV